MTAVYQSYNSCKVLRLCFGDGRRLDDVSEVVLVARCAN